MALHKYWITFKMTWGDAYPLQLLQGCGVTAFSRDDAISLINERILRDAAMPPIEEIIDDVDVSTLDRNHVLPNISNPVVRGIWFPADVR